MASLGFLSRALTLGPSRTMSRFLLGRPRLLSWKMQCRPNRSHRAHADSPSGTLHLSFETRHAMHDLANGVGLEIAPEAIAAGEPEASIVATWWGRPGHALLPVSAGGPQHPPSAFSVGDCVAWTHNIGITVVMEYKKLGYPR